MKIHTKHWIVEKCVENSGDYPQYQSSIHEAAKLIQQNQLVAFPTETVYGLGGNGLVDETVDKIYQAKGRPSDNPLILHISTRYQLQGLVTHIPPMAEALMDAFWPGPLTLVLPKRPGTAMRASAGLDTVAVRMPDHPVALDLINEAGVPIAAPSANLSGRPSPTTAQHVLQDLDGRIAGVLDGGPTGIGVESTVVDASGEVPIILRPGGITPEQIAEITGEVAFDPGLTLEGVAPRSPGMKYRHYAPEGEMWLVEGDHIEDTISTINRLIAAAREQGRKVGVLTTEENQQAYPLADQVFPCGKREELITVAHNLYDVLRKMDDKKVDFILSETFPEQGVGQAIMNRLRKAAGGKRYTP